MNEDNVLKNNREHRADDEASDDNFSSQEKKSNTINCIVADGKGREYLLVLLLLLDHDLL